MPPRHLNLGSVALFAVLALAPSAALAQAIIRAVPTAAGCNSTEPCVSVPVTISGVPTPVGFKGVRGVHVLLRLTGDLKFCTGDPRADITRDATDYLGVVPNTDLFIVANANGTVIVDQAINGDPAPCQTDAAGRLFTLNLGTTVAGGSGTVVIDEVTVRDCANETIAAIPGPPATVSFSTGGGAPLMLTVTAVPAVIWPPDKKLHDIHVNFTVTGGCGTVKVVLTSIKASCAAEGHHSEKKPDVVGADFGQPDFDFQLRARACDDDDDDHHGEDKCEDECEKRCERQCASQCDRHCDQITDSKRRKQCMEEQKECYKKCEKKCDKECDAACEKNRDLIYTITYTASDLSSQSVTATTTVLIHGDKKGHGSISIATGGPSNPYGATQSPEWKLAIPSILRATATKENGTVDAVDRSEASETTAPRLRFDGTSVDPSQVFIGNSNGLVPVTGVRFTDLDNDGFDDVTAELGSLEAKAVRELVVGAEDPLLLFFRTREGRGYEVAGLFDALGRVVVAPPPPDEPSRRDDSFGNRPGTLVPLATQLGRAFPNPSRGMMSFSVELADKGETNLDVFDLRGALVRSLVSGTLPAGRYEHTWDGRDESGRQVPNGLYLVRMRAGAYRATRSALLVR